MLVPRESRLVRLYIQLSEFDTDNTRLDRSKVTAESLLRAAKKTIAPYTLDCEVCDWWSVYQVCLISSVQKQK